MYNYNLINPINITYRNPKQNPYTNSKEDEGASGSNGGAQKPVTLDENRGQQRQFPNGNKVQVDYTKNKVNIAQVIEDFKSTIAAINAPKEVSDEVHLYLNLVEAESKKENPSREIILSNLKNASKISDKFIEESLKKPSTVVEDWVNALFLQKVELKSNPGFVNEDFRVQIPENKKAQDSLYNVQNPSVTGGAAPISAAGDNTASQYSINALNSRPVQVNRIENYSNNVSNVSAQNLDRVSSAGDFQNSPLNIYDIPQNQITINEIKPIGQARVDFQPRLSQVTSQIPQASVQTQAAVEVQPVHISENLSQIDFNGGVYGAEIQSAPEYNTNLTYSTTAAPLEQSLGAAVSFVEEAVPESVSGGVYKINATMQSATGVPDAAPAVVNTDREQIHPVQHISVLNEQEQAARKSFVRAKRIVKENGDPYSALKLYDEALKLVQDSGDDNLKAAIYFERGKVFDDYDYPEYALKDYNNATKCTDNNLKTHAHIGMGRIYDDYAMLDPAVQQYSLAVETSEEAKNPAGKTRALRYLAALFADRYDKNNTEIFNSLSVDAAYETGNSKIIAKTLMETAENFEYIGEDVKALESYKKAAKVLYDLKDYETLSSNYEAASDIMERLGNEPKAMSLLSKALAYRQKAELQAA